ncbi:Outer membrane lipoprotein-sorting protein [uncultured Candidatus Thioglobus sp.]|nr:Outer membrane lipoprotein-sorting protein [uncultured Candidatus Thioglobus sp.]
MKKVILLLVISFFANADNANEVKGLKIAKKVEQLDTGWGDFQAQMQMTLVNRKGQKSTRSIRSKNLEVIGDGDKSMSIFDEPRDIKGTTMLTFSHQQKADEQWLYLPALKRIKRISSRNKSGPFMGSEFAFEDLSSQEVDKYQHFYLKDEKLGEIETFKNKRIPTYKHTGYTKQFIWIDAKRYIPLKIEFYDRKNSLLKTLTFKNYKQYLNKFWRANLMEMTNHQNGKKTLLEWKDYRFNTGLKTSDFRSNKLKRQR